MKIKLTQGKETPVESRDYKFLSQWSWCYAKHHSGKGGYAIRTDKNGQTIYMHRMILERMGYKDSQQGDHIDRNKLNNLRNNLRPAISRQSVCNRNKFSNNTSGYIGVHWNKANRKWLARISVNRKRLYLGCFDFKIEAAKAYNKAAKKYNGKFVVLNKV